jgi:hypothetical protein
LKALGIMFLIGLICLVVLIPVYFILSIIDPARPGAPTLITGATFGGTIDAFQAKYGDPQPSGVKTTKAWKVTINGLHVLISVTPAAEEANDGQNHIMAMSIGPDSGTWSQSTADQILPTFLPGDATYQKDEQVPGVGLARVYLSPDLGETFAASDFVDAQGNMITPGTFMASFNTSLKGAYVLKLGA